MERSDRFLPALAVLATLAACLPVGAAEAAPATTSSAPATPGKMVTLQGIRSATVAPGGVGFASLAFSSKRGGPKGFINDTDGSAVVGFGLGDAAQGVGIQISANITSLSDNFGDSGHFSVKFARKLPGEAPTYLALSFDRLSGWGDARNTKPATSLSLTTFRKVDIAGQSYPVMLTIGAGNRVRNFSQDSGIFVGAGIGLTPNFGASLAYAGDQVALGSAFKVAGLKNMVFSATLDDAFNQQSAQRVTVSATVVFSNLFGG